MARKTGGSEPARENGGRKIGRLTAREHRQLIDKIAETWIKENGSTVIETHDGDVRVIVELRGVRDLSKDVRETLKDEMLQAIWDGVLPERGIIHAELRA